MHDLDAPRVPFDAGDDIVSIIRRHADRAPDQLALIEGERSVDYAALRMRIDSIARGLVIRGLGPGCRIATLGRNGIEHVESFLGVLAAGASVVPLPTMATAESLRAMLVDANVELIFVGKSHEDIAIEALTGGSSVRDDGRVGLDFESDVFESLSHLAEGAEGAALPVIGGTCEFDVIYSSGTTGIPKGIIHSHAVRKASYAGSRARYFDPRTVNIVTTPLYSNTTCVTWLLSTAAGGTNVLMSKFDADEFLRLVERRRGTHAMLVPVQHDRLLRSPELGTRDTSSLSYLFSTSAPLRAETKQGILQNFPAELVEIYGMTEGGVVTVLEARARPDKLASVGRPSPGSDVRVIDDDGCEVGAGRTGEVVGRSSSMMCGYLNRPDATRELSWRDPDGRLFFRSGDIGRLDEDGFLHLSDRKKDVIISGGFNVYASDIEAVLFAHPDVREVTVIGIPSDRFGESPLALVVRQDGSQVTEEELMRWCNARVGKAQRVAGVELRDDLPKNAIGKVLKRDLRSPYWKDR